MNDYYETLESIAARGTPRGPSGIFDAALADASFPPAEVLRPARERRRPQIALLTAVAALIIVVVGLVLIARDHNPGPTVDLGSEVDAFTNTLPPHTLPMGSTTTVDGFTFKVTDIRPLAPNSPALAIQLDVAADHTQPVVWSKFALTGPQRTNAAPDDRGSADVHAGTTASVGLAWPNTTADGFYLLTYDGTVLWADFRPKAPTITGPATHLLDRTTPDGIALSVDLGSVPVCYFDDHNKCGAGNIGPGILVYYRLPGQLPAMPITFGSTPMNTDLRVVGSVGVGSSGCPCLLAVQTKSPKVRAHLADGSTDTTQPVQGWVVFASEQTISSIDELDATGNFVSTCPAALPTASSGPCT